MSSKLTWLHLSDLHMEKKDSFNRGIVIEALLNDLRRHKSQGVCPDLIFFSGDVAYNGSEAEYKLAKEEFFEKLFAVLNLGPEALILAPGNHDLRRKIANDCPNPVKEWKDAEDLSRHFTDNDKMKMLLLPFSWFQTFGESHSVCASQACSPVYADVHEFLKDGKRIMSITLNTAIVSSYNKKASGEVEDQGHLAISEHQVLMALKRIDKADLIITVMHHPLDWLLPFDRDRVEHLILKNSDVILSGHLHRPYTAFVVDQTSATLIVRAGSIFDKRTSPNNYNIVELDLDNRSGRVLLRRYNGREWVRDTDTTGDDANGVFQFSLVDQGITEPVLTDLPQEVKEFTSTQPCRDDMKRLGITAAELTELLKNEFNSHVGYLLQDLESYPMPVRASYIVYLNKHGSKVEMFRVIGCTSDIAMLSAWNEILRFYRRALRFEYRKTPMLLMRSRSVLPRVLVLHSDIRRLIVNFFREYKELDVSPISARIAKSVKDRYKDALPPRNFEAKVPNSLSDKVTSIRETVRHGLSESESACQEAAEIQKGIRIGDVGVETGLGEIVAELERSLQHLHQIILNFPPQ